MNCSGAARAEDHAADPAAGDGARSGARVPAADRGPADAGGGVDPAGEQSRHPHIVRAMLPDGTSLRDIERAHRVDILGSCRLAHQRAGRRGNGAATLAVPL